MAHAAHARAAPPAVVPKRRVGTPRTLMLRLVCASIAELLTGGETGGSGGGGGADGEGGAGGARLTMAMAVKAPRRTLGRAPDSEGELTSCWARVASQSIAVK